MRNDYNEKLEKFNGIVLTWHFPNGYGASVIKHDYSYGGSDGLWEGAVLHHDMLCYDTPITDDVIGYMNCFEVDKFLNTIEALPEKTS